MSELGSQAENGMTCDFFRDIFVSLFLIANVDETMVYPHLEFVGRLILAALVFVEFFQTRQGYT